MVYKYFLRKIYILFLLIIIFPLVVYADVKNNNTEKEEKVKEEPPKIGNFSLRGSQQPGSLIGIGQNILDKNQLQLYLFGDYFEGVRQHMVDLMPSLLYGITDSLSIFLTLPVAVSYKYNENHSSGLGDASIQLEYAYYTKETFRYSEEATIVASMKLPTGSDKKQPPTGMGSPSFLVGAGYQKYVYKMVWIYFSGNSFDDAS